MGCEEWRVHCQFHSEGDARTGQQFRQKLCCASGLADSESPLVHRTNACQLMPSTSTFRYVTAPMENPFRSL
jgi:hypothetical protein